MNEHKLNWRTVLDDDDDDRSTERRDESGSVFSEYVISSMLSQLNLYIVFPQSH